MLQKQLRLPDSGNNLTPSCVQELPRICLAGAVPPAFTIAFRAYRGACADSTRKMIIFRPRRRRSRCSLRCSLPESSVGSAVTSGSGLDFPLPQPVRAQTAKSAMSNAESSLFICPSPMLCIPIAVYHSQRRCQYVSMVQNAPAPRRCKPIKPAKKADPGIRDPRISDC